MGEEIMNDTYITIGDRITELRKSAGLTQQELSELLDIPVATLGHVEVMSHQSIKWSLLKSIASVLTKSGTPQELFETVNCWINEDKPMLVEMTPDEQKEFQLFLKWKSEREQALKNGNAKHRVHRDNSETNSGL